MDTNVAEYLNSGKYLPPFMRDHHDQKNLFKRLDRIVQNRKDVSSDVNWIAGNIYTVDIFLWFMAAHGYTLQKSRKHISFSDIDSELAEFEAKQREASANVLKQMFLKTKSND